MSKISFSRKKFAFIGKKITLIMILQIFQIVVVPDSEIAKKVPSVPGLITYRKDNKELYVRSNKTWKVIALEKKVI